MSEEGLGPETSQKMQLKILGVDLVIGFFLCFLFYTIVFPLAPAFKYVMGWDVYLLYIFSLCNDCCANCIAGHGMKIANVCNLLAIPQCIV